MDFRNEKSPLENFKETDMVSFLYELGFQPSTIRGHDYWYSSPLRNERTASFKVNRRLNKWFDHGPGKGGNLVDFGILYYNCSVGELLQKLGSALALDQPVHHYPAQPHTEQENKIQILDVKPLFSTPLFQYLSERKIPSKIASIHCKEVVYDLGGKHYYAIGFGNKSGGYELRNAFVKLSSSPKDFTLIDKGSKDIHVFEGFFDMLSYQALYNNSGKLQQSILVLNSISLFEKARSVLETHEKINLYLDRDKAGMDQTQYAVSLGHRYQDKSSLYQRHKDLNDWLVSFESVHRKYLNLKRGLNPNESL
ncbi:MULTISPECIES: toprim domain-containing protein [Dyadobacter]|uniref:DNA primase n=1 Tax=Dyadobacter psychrotolerans TaxID=2541721 RepID=A0A4R5DGP7_9BACT|nr:toprim domain-containing protein [Dyadobacter psychrotolerans]TDE13202.1 DNA primase [Dyadobacter psychrotolerans]